MPRKPDAELEGRIVDAAYKLWSERGEKALTMRAVARASATTTPTLYERFRDKTDLKHFLEDRAKQNLLQSVKQSHSALDACERILKFIAGHGNESRLLMAGWDSLLKRGTQVFSFEFLQRLLAKDLGGTAKQHRDLALQLLALIHGTAVLRMEAKEHVKSWQELHHACVGACAALIENAGKANGKRNPHRKN